MNYAKAICTAGAAALLLSACGGGGSNNNDNGNGANLPAIKTVKVFGGALAGGSYSIQEVASSTWSESVAAAFGAPPLCNYYIYKRSNLVGTSTYGSEEGCTNYASGTLTTYSIYVPVSGTLTTYSPEDWYWSWDGDWGQINDWFSFGSEHKYIGKALIYSRSAVEQLTDAARVGFSDQELALIQSGSDDAFELLLYGLQIDGYGLQIDGKEDFAQVTKTLLKASEVDSALKQPDGWINLGTRYMTALADYYYGTIQNQVLSHGRMRVAILNIPAIHLAPGYNLFHQSGEGIWFGDPALDSKIKGILKQWVEAFNKQLNERAKNHPLVTVIDLYAISSELITNPAAAGLSNVSKSACDYVLTSEGLYFPIDCTATALSKVTPPKGSNGGADWWQTYLFAHSQYLTPYGNQKVSEKVLEALKIKGWLAQ